MSWLKVVAARTRGLFRRSGLDRELDEEVRFHLEMQIEDNLRLGMNPTEARRAALRSFGGVESTKETYRERRAFAVVEETAQDVRYAARTLRKSPGFAITVIVVLALAIGVNTAMFSVMNVMLFRPLPYKAPDQLMMLWSEDPAQNLREGRSSYWNAEQWRSQSKLFADMAFYDAVSLTLISPDRAEKISGVRTTPNLFALLGVQPLHGRIFSREESEQRQRLAVISHRFWQTRFGGSLDAIGATIHLNGAASQIVGILPAHFQFDDADVWEPHTMYPNWEALRSARGPGFWSVIGRLRPNVTIKQAQAEMNTIGLLMSSGITVVPLSLHVMGARPRLGLWMLSGAVLLVLLIAATNVASLSLARNASREREIAVRAALGASRARIVRHLLAESLTLSIIAGLLGFLAAYAGIRLIVTAKPGNLARLNEVSLDPYVLGCASALCLVTGVLVGLTPAITMARRNLRSSGQEGGRGVAGGRATVRARRTLVVTEFALASILLAGAGLLVRSLWSAENVDPGFNPNRVLSVSLAPAASTSTAQWAGFYNRVIERVESLPGVESAGVTSELFINGGSELVVTVEGNARSVPEQLRYRSDEISEGLFRALGTPLLSGRFFSSADGPNSPPVAIVNAALARRLWPGRDPLGKRFKRGPERSGGKWFTVIGIVGDMRRQGLEKDPIPQMFEPMAQNPPGHAILLVRTSMGDPLKMAAAVQAAVRDVEKYAVVYAVTTLEGQLGSYLSERRFQTSLLIGFSVVALLIAAIGIYGLIQYSIAMRTREIGIRIAVGAQAGAIFRLILGEGLKLSLAGLALGLAVALWLGRVGSSLLFGVTPTDPLTFITISSMLIAVGVAACFFPARRAMKVEPVVALRQD